MGIKYLRMMQGGVVSFWDAAYVKAGYSLPPARSEVCKFGKPLCAPPGSASSDGPKAAHCPEVSTQRPDVAKCRVFGYMAVCVNSARRCGSFALLRWQPGIQGPKDEGS